jgi:hypothetical protein
LLIFARLFGQDTPVELGPTAIMPKSQFLLHSPPGGVNTVPYEPQAEAIHLAGPAGTVGIVHYDMLHTSTNKALLETRHSESFLSTFLSHFLSHRSSGEARAFKSKVSLSNLFSDSPLASLRSDQVPVQPHDRARSLRPDLGQH